VLQAAFRALPRAVLGVGVLTATLPATASAIGAATLKDGDPDLNKRLRGMEDGDSGGRFGRLLKALGGKEPVTDEDPVLHKRLRGMGDGGSEWRFDRLLRALAGKKPVAEQDDVSLKESCTLVLLESDWTWTWTWP
jgi:hypothetical protein